ncbi:hypothetical protein ACQY0O_007419 [Thecaphora frezii]
MSTDGRPIATITPGVAIYVTALLEFVGEHILQNVVRVIERDNSDEASLNDLKAALTEDELLAGLFNKMAIKAEIDRRIELSQSRRLRRLNGSGLPDDLFKGGKQEARVVKPWQVPTEKELDEAAAPTRFSARRTSLQPVAHMSRQDSQHERASSSGHSYAQSGTLHSDSTSASTLVHSPTTTTVTSASGSIPASKSVDNRPSITRRSSMDKGWSGVFGQMKRRNSLRQSSEVSSGAYAKTLAPPEANLPTNDSALEPEDDFEALMLSGQTMKVSLTPNRLRTIEVAKQEAEAKKNARRRPGALTLPLRDDLAGAGSAMTPSPGRRASVQLTEAPGPDSAETGRLSRRPSSRNSLQAPSSWNSHPDRKFGSQPPSSYRSPSPALTPQPQGPTSFGLAEEDAESANNLSKGSRRMQPREGQIDRYSQSQEMVDFLRSAPSQDTASSHGSLRLSESGSDGSRKVGVGSRVRNLFGRKASISGKDFAPSPPRQSMNSVRDDAHSVSGYASPSNASSVASHTELPRSPPLSGSVGRRSMPSRPEASPIAESSRSSSATRLERPVSTASAPPVQVAAANNLSPSTSAAATPASAIVSSGSAESSAFNGTPTRLGTARPEASGATEDRKSLNGQNRPNSAGLIGLYEEGKQRPWTPPSPPTRQRADELPSRKVPWGYKRYSASSYNRADADSTGTPSSDKRRSIGYQSSNGHGGSSFRPARLSTENGDMPPHSVPADEASVIHGGNNGVSGGRTPTLFYTSNGRRGSCAQSSRAPSREGSLFGTHQRPLASAAVVLADLERLMRSCSTVDECRSLVLKALAASNVGGSGSEANEPGSSVCHGSIADIPDEASSLHSAHMAPTTDYGGQTIARDAVSAFAAAPTPASSSAHAAGQQRTAPSSEAKAITSLEARDQDLVVAWLLAGDEKPALVVSPPSPLRGLVLRPNGKPRSGPLASAGSKVRGPYTGGAKAKMGSMVSLESSYRDASEGHGDEA